MSKLLLAPHNGRKQLGQAVDLWRSTVKPSRRAGAANAAAKLGRRRHHGRPAHGVAD